MGKRNIIQLCIVTFVILSICIGCTVDGFNKKEINLIMSKDSASVFQLLTINNKADSLFLRQSTRKIRKNDVGSPYMQQLKSRLLKTVKDTINPGVGIAAPQIGIGVQMIYVQRFDKEGEPFEVYYNPIIEEYGDSINSGLEGCLSVPGYRCKVDRSHNIKINYIDSTGKKQKEEVNGFVAVIFQHEIDHLNGILYFDHVYGGFNSLSKIDSN